MRRNSVDVLNIRLDIAGGHALGIDLLLNILADAGLVLFQYLGFKFPFLIPRSQNFYIFEAGPKCFATVAVPFVIGILVLIVIFAAVRFLSIYAASQFSINSAIIYVDSLRKL